MSDEVDTTNVHNEEYRTYRHVESESKILHNKGDSVFGHEVFKWPETEAFLKRLGVDVTQPITGVKIHLPCAQLATVTIEQHVEDQNYEG